MYSFFAGLSYVCGNTYNGQYMASSRKLKIEYTPLKVVHHYNVMTLIATAFHEGKEIAKDDRQMEGGMDGQQER